MRIILSAILMAGAMGFAAAVMAGETTETEYHFCKPDSGITAIIPQSAADTAHVFDVPPHPLPKFSPQPNYPEKAKVASVQGKVVVNVLVDTQGEIVKWSILRAEPAGQGFETEVAKIICGWRFSPALKEHQPVNTWVAIPFNFKFKR
jgi:TonB family protein